MPESVWRRFTPDFIDPGKCLARVFNGGFGGQCSKLAAPGSQLCKQHMGWGGQVHGLVTGPIPRAKVRRFLQAEIRNVRRKRASEGVVGGDGAVVEAEGCLCFFCVSLCFYFSWVRILVNE